MDQVRIYTFKAGLLARVAHDLRLHVESGGFSVTRTGDRVSAEFDPHRIVVDGAMVGARLDLATLSDRDRDKIGETIRAEILQTNRHPKVRFSGSVIEQGRRLEIEGELELVGVRRRLVFTGNRDHERITARVELTLSEFGIAPYKALAGAIRLQDRVIVEFDLGASPSG